MVIAETQARRDLGPRAFERAEKFSRPGNSAKGDRRPGVGRDTEPARDAPEAALGAHIAPQLDSRAASSWRSTTMCALLSDDSGSRKRPTGSRRSLTSAGCTTTISTARANCRC